MVEVQVLHHFHNVFKGLYIVLVIRNFQTSVIKSASSDQNFRSVTFCIISELVAYKLIFLSKQTGICVTKTARNVRFGKMKLKWKKKFNI